MVAAGASPNVISCSSAISAMEKRGYWAWSLDLLQRMASLAVAPNEISFSGAVGACEKALSRSFGRRQVSLGSGSPAAMLKRRHIVCGTCR